MIETYNLSYVLTTFNKLMYLKEVMKRLLENVKPDEEIVVVDGGSTDGTKEFLQELFLQKKIHQFISEPDKGEAHGFNKGILLAKGQLIKILTDDDVYSYPNIEECKNYMLSNPEIIALGSDVAYAFLSNIQHVITNNEANEYAQKWKKGIIDNFSFTGLGLMIRKDKLAITGLFHTGLLLVDCEYAFRVTSLENFVWYSGITAIHIANSKSNYHTQSGRAKTESKKIIDFYGWQPPKKKLQEQVKSFLRLIFYSTINFLSFKENISPNQWIELSPELLEKAFAYYDKWLVVNNNEKFEFISKK